MIYVCRRKPQGPHPGQSDGFIRVWFVEKQVYGTTSVRFREIPELKIDSLFEAIRNSFRPATIFFGHHGREPDAHPVIEVPMIECTAGHGIRGDRFYDLDGW